MGTALAAIIAALFAAAATVLAAVQARKANSATVDVRILTYLKDDVVQLQQRVAELRRDLHSAQDETDAERRVRRRVEQELMAVQDLAERMGRALVAAGMDLPEGAMFRAPAPGLRAPPAPPAPETPL